MNAIDLTVMIECSFNRIDFDLDDSNVEPFIRWALSKYLIMVDHGLVGTLTDFIIEKIRGAPRGKGYK